jgi:hypothetical protein
MDKSIEFGSVAYPSVGKRSTSNRAVSIYFDIVPKSYIALVRELLQSTTFIALEGKAIRSQRSS